MLSSPEATPSPLALHHPHLPLYALLSIGSCFAIGFAAYVELVAPPSKVLHDPPPRVAATLVNLHELAYRAFPRWQVDNPLRECPATIGELARYTTMPTISPYTGRPYGYTCAEYDLPAGVHGIWIVDLGDDGKVGTDDDITSDQTWVGH